VGVAAKRSYAAGKLAANSTSKAVSKYSKTVSEYSKTVSKLAYNASSRVSISVAKAWAKAPPMKMKFPALRLGNLSSWMPASGRLSRFFARSPSSKAAARVYWDAVLKRWSTDDDVKEGAGCLPLAVVIWGGVVAYSASEDVRDAVDPALSEVRKVVEPAARELVHVTKTVGSNAVTAAKAAGSNALTAAKDVGSNAFTAAKAAGSEAQRMVSAVGGEASSWVDRCYNRCYNRLLVSEPPQKIVKK
jgi:hypothetical protein